MAAMAQTKPDSAQEPVSRRERVRAATLAEIKGCALDLMREQGSIQVHFSDIARAMGMTAPALYRYFADRDDLLTALIRDAYNDLAEVVNAAVSPVPLEDDWGRLRAGMQAYRSWGDTQPERFTLIFGLPIPGFVVDEEAGTTEAARGAMDALMALVVGAHQGGRLEPPVLTRVDSRVADLMAEKRPAEDTSLPPAACEGVLHAWMTVHGFVALEAFGHLEWWPQEVRDSVFEAQVELAARAIGIAVPAR
jgi:AcrR family transcriptional regulator